MWYKSQIYYKFHKNNQVFFKHGNQKACQVNLAMLGTCLYPQNLTKDLGYLLPLIRNCYNKQIQNYLHFHVQLTHSLYFRIHFDQYHEIICQVYESNSHVNHVDYQISHLVQDFQHMLILLQMYLNF